MISRCLIVSGYVPLLKPHASNAEHLVMNTYDAELRYVDQFLSDCERAYDSPQPFCLEHADYSVTDRHDAQLRCDAQVLSGVEGIWLPAQLHALHAVPYMLLVVLNCRSGSS